MSKPICYLAGAMSGLSYMEANNWREEITGMITPEISVLNPMRGQPKEGFEKACAGQCNAGFEMSRDMLDLERCDIVIARFALNAPTSFGTAIELGILIPLRKPAIFVLNEKDRLMTHPFLLAFPRGIITHNLEDCASLLYSMFNL